MNSPSMHRKGPIYIVPLLTTLVGTTYSLNSVGVMPGGGDVPIEPIRYYPVIVGYILAFILSFINLGATLRLFSSVKILLVLLAFALISAMWSDFPMRVFQFCAHGISQILVVICAALYVRGRPTGLYVILLMYCIVTLSLSAVLAVFFPELGLAKFYEINIWSSNVAGRWKGITVHPNHLGMACVFSCWAAMACLTLGTSRLVRIVALTTLALAIACLMGSRSMTSISTLVVMGTVYLWSLRGGGRGVSPLIVLFGLGAFALGMIAVLVIFYFGDSLSSNSALNVVGRDGTLSGRTAIWQIGFDVFSERPFMGWSFDNLTTLLTSSGSFMRHGQFHNGYIDMAVRGGIVGFGIMMLLAISAFRRTRRLMNAAKVEGLFLMVFLVGALFHNLAEASLFRYVHEYWLLFTLVWVVAIDMLQQKTASQAA